MKIRGILLLLLLLKTGHVYCQFSEEEIDSIKLQLSIEFPDSVRLVAYNDLAYYYRRADTELSSRYLNEVEPILYQVNNDYELARFLKTKGLLAYYAFFYNEAEEYFLEALSLLGTNEKDRYLKSTIFLSLNNLYQTKSNYNKATTASIEGLKIAKNIKDYDLMSSFYNALGSIYERLQEPIKAKEYYKACYDLKDKFTSKKKKVFVQTIYGRYLVYEYMELEDSLKIQNKDQLKEAVNILNEAYEGYNDLGDSLKMITITNIIGSASEFLENYDKALNAFQKALKLYTNRNDQQGIAQSNYNIAVLYNKQKKFQLSIQYAQQALEASLISKNISLSSNAHASLSMSFEGLGDTKKGLFHHKEYRILKDSFNSIEKRKEIEEVEALYKNQLLIKDNELLQKENESKTRRNRFIVIIGLLLIGIIGFFLYNQYLKTQSERTLALKERQLHLEKENALKKEIEVKSINALINGQEKERKRIAQSLHDSMGSLLSAISMQYNSLRKNITFTSNESMARFEKISQLMQEAHQYNREVAYELMPPVLTKFGLAASINFLADKFRTSKTVILTDIYGLKERLEEELELALYRIVEESLSNAIKYADANEISIQLTEHEKELTILIEDDGKGFNYDPKNPNFGMGLNSIKSRIAFFGGSFDIDSHLGKGTTVILNVPLKFKSKI